MRYRTDTGRVRDITAPVDKLPLRSRPTQGTQDERTLSRPSQDGIRTRRSKPLLTLAKLSPHKGRYVCRIFCSEEPHLRYCLEKMAVVASA